MHYLFALLVIINLSSYAASDSELFSYAASGGKSGGRIRSLTSSSNGSIAKPKTTFGLMSRAAEVTDAQVAKLLDKCVADNDVVLSDPLQSVKALGLQRLCTTDTLLMSATQYTLQKITDLKDIADQRAFALKSIEREQTDATRLSAWQMYHMGVMGELKLLIEKSIPDTSADVCGLSITYNSITRITLTPEQIDRLRIHVVAYALMLSELETHDMPAFEQAFGKLDAAPEESALKKSNHEKKCILQ